MSGEYKKPYSIKEKLFLTGVIGGTVTGLSLIKQVFDGMKEKIAKNPLEVLQTSGAKDLITTTGTEVPVVCKNATDLEACILEYGNGAVEVADALKKVEQNIETKSLIESLRAMMSSLLNSLAPNMDNLNNGSGEFIRVLGGVTIILILLIVLYGLLSNKNR